MPWFLNPSVYQKLPLYQNPELYLFFVKVAAVVVFAALLRRAGVGGRRLLGTAFVFLFGTFLTVMLSMHNLVIAGLYLFDRPSGGTPAYDFRLYSLLLLGSLLVVQGVNAIRAALRLKAGDEKGIVQARKATLIVLAAAVPLIPLQFFGTVLTVLGLINLAALKLARPAPAASPEQTDDSIWSDSAVRA